MIYQDFQTHHSHHTILKGHNHFSFIFMTSTPALARLPAPDR